MTVEIVTIPCLTENYAYLAHDPASGGTVLVDAPETAAIAAALDARGWVLSDILLTHHHNDHIAGVAGLRGPHVRVIGAAADAHRLPPLDLAVSPGESFGILGLTAEVIDVPGHTVGHVAFHIPALAALFTGDSLMAAGCGRLFEGTPAQMWDSLSRLAALPAATVVYSGHEYTAGNLRFAATLEPENPALAARTARVAALRAADRPSVPATLAEELATNPFLRAESPAIRKALAMPDAPAAAVFAEIRARKDRF